MSTEFREPLCLMCSSTDSDVLQSFSSPDPYELALGLDESEYFRSWLRCRECGFHFSHYSRPSTAFDELYSSTYREVGASWRANSTREIFNKVVALPAELSETKERIAWIKNSIGELRGSGILAWGSGPFRLLDIGGATGVFAFEFMDGEWNSTIVDPSEAGRFITEHGVGYLCRPYQPSLFDQPFHLVSLIFALEHMLDPGAILAAARKDVSDGGVVYVEVPDAVAFRLKAPDDDIFNSTHLWMFDPNNLVRLMAQAGFQPAALRRIKTKRGHYALRVLGMAT